MKNGRVETDLETVRTRIQENIERERERETIPK